LHVELIECQHVEIRPTPLITRFYSLVCEETVRVRYVGLRFVDLYCSKEAGGRAASLSGSEI